MDQIEKKAMEVERKDEKGLPPYEPPAMVTHSSDDLLERIGPAQTCTPFGF